MVRSARRTYQGRRVERIMEKKRSYPPLWEKVVPVVLVAGVVVAAVLLGIIGYVLFSTAVN